MTKEQILSQLQQSKSLLEQQFGVVRIGLFGSYARGEAREDSDIDIAIEMQPDQKTLRNFFGCKRALERQLGVPVDLGIESSLKPLVLERIQGEIVYV